MPHPRKIALCFSFLLIALTSNALDFYWFTPSGDYNDGNNWVDGSGNKLFAVPGPGDNVYFGSYGACTVNFPGGGTYEANDFNADNATFNFNGSNFATININIYGSITLNPSVTLNYLTYSTTSWTIVGNPSSPTMHLISTDGQDFEKLKMGSEFSTIEIKSDILASRSLQFLEGVLNAEGIAIDCGNFLIGTLQYGPNNAASKEIYLDGSVITCTASTSSTPGQFLAKYHDPGTIQLHGNYEIHTQSFNISDIQLDKAVVTDWQLEQNLNLSAPSGSFRNVHFNDFVIDNEYRSLFLGSFKVGNFNVINPGSRVSFRNLIDEPEGDTLTITGNVTLPSGGTCDLLTVLENDDFLPYYFHRNSGAATFNYALISNIRKSGAGTFNITNGKVVGNNPGWQVLSSVASKQFYWYNGTGNWFDPAHWSLIPKNFDNPGGCIPGPVDDVIIDEYGFTGSGQIITMDNSKSVMYRNFSWQDNPFAGVIDLNIPLLYAKERLRPTGFGDFTICSTCSFNINPAKFTYYLRFQGVGSIDIQKNNFTPYLEFRGDFASLTLDHALTLANNVDFNGGTFFTNNRDIHANSISSTSSSTTFNLGSSSIEGSAKVRLRYGLSTNVVNGSQASIKTPELDCENCTLKSLELLNTAPAHFNNDLTLQKFILAGTSPVLFHVSNKTLSVDTLIMRNGTSLRLNANLMVNGQIISEADSLTPALIEDYSTYPVDLSSDGPLCARGFISFDHVEFQGDLLLHAPQGNDLGNNSGLYFGGNTFTDKLYWIGQQGDFSYLPNWSNIPGGCPTEIADLNTVDSLFIDRSGTSDKDTLFVNDYTQVKNVLVKDSLNPVSAYKLYFEINEPLVARSLVLDNVYTYLNGYADSSQQNTEVKLTRNLTVQNSGGCLFSDLHFILGEDYVNASGPIWQLIDYASVMDARTGDGSTMITLIGAVQNDTTVYIGPNTAIDISETDLIIDSSSPYPVLFRWPNKKVNSLIFRKQSEYYFTGPVRIRKSMNLENGTIVKGEFNIEP